MQDFIDESVFDRFCPDTIQGDFMKHSKKGSRGPRLYFSHFQNRILCAFLLCTLIPIFIIGGISYAVSYNIAKDKILNASISADAQLHTQFDNRMQQVENIADTLQYNMYNLMQADAPMDTLAMLSEIRSNLSMFKTSFDLAYIRDGKYPYMVGEDAEKFRKLCEESGEFALKKFAEMTGLIQKLDDNTVAYVGDNGIAVKSKDGKEMFVDTSGLSYDIVMDMFRNLPRNGNFFSNKYWSDNIQKAQARS